MSKPKPLPKIKIQTLDPETVRLMEEQQGAKAFWTPASLFHEDIITVAADEVMVWGAKGTGKSTAARIKAARGVPKGVPYEADGTFHPHRLWQCWHPDFRGLVLRKTSDDLADWFDKFRTLVELLGGTAIESPRHVRWPTGGITRFGHLSDAGSWTKYVGNDTHMAVVEEAVSIEDEEQVNLLTTCIRTTSPEIGTQLMFNCNPLGPGLKWIIPRFYSLSPGDGYNRIIKVNGVEITGVEYTVKPKDQIEILTRDIDGTYLSRTRTTLFGTLEDNPSQNTPAYRAALASNPDNIVRAYMFGEIARAQGAAFPMIRLKGPLSGEPPEADHLWEHSRILEQLEPWYPVHVGMDWGFAHEAAGVIFHGAKHGRLFGLEEYIQASQSAEELGFQVGLRLIPYLNKGQYVTIHFSPDAWDIRNETGPTVQLLLKGLSRATDNRVLLTENPFDVDWTAPRGRVGVRKANNRRVAGAEKIRGMLRFRPLLAEGEGHPFSHGASMEILSEQGRLAYERYQDAWRKSSPEVLPKLIFSKSGCPRTATAFRDALQADDNPKDVTKDHWAGADRYDAGRYGIMGWREVDTPIPMDVQIERQIDALRHGGLDPQSLVYHARRLEDERTRKQFAIRQALHARGLR